MNRPRAICLALCLAAAMPAPAAAPASVQAVAPAPALRYPARPIASRAQLDAYLRDTPASTSPLGALTAAGRLRFLAALVFSEHGLGGFGTDDLRYDLTRTQAWQVLRLFAVEGYAAELPARTRPRPPDGPGATLEAAYDRLMATPGDTASAAALYAQAFAPPQASLASLALHAEGELPFVHELDMPVFYVLRHGQLAATVVGWPGPQQRDALRRRFAEVGLLHLSGPSRSLPSTDIR